MRRGGWTGLGAVALLAIGCTQDSLDLHEGGDPLIPRPQFPWSPGATPTATPVLTFGNGSDGALAVNGNLSVNACDRIGGVSGNRVTTDPAFFPVGSSVLLWQTQDQFAISGSQAVVTSASMALAGAWQLVRVTAAGADYIDVDAGTLLPFDSGDRFSAQACHVPEYTDVNVPPLQRIEAVQWTPGSGGGVVAFFASGTLSLGGTVSASGRGFTGAAPHVSGTGGPVIADDVASAEGGQKGDGLDGGSSTRYGRGNWANAAGGGNAHSAGGGGGGNAGAGGSGGKQWKPAGNEPLTAGLGGAAVATTYPIRLVMGGGGGEGQGHHGGAGSGGDGGGLVLIFARQITGSGTILSSGDAGADSIDDAGSGGGAGGTIVLQAEVSTFTGIVRARGGNGADASFDGGVGDAEISGPGGGGGGGHIHLVLDSASSPFVTDVAGGANGTNALQDDDPWGAMAGAPGIVH